jgi:hypothetical protein
MIDTVQVTMPKPHIKYKIISCSRSWDICYENTFVADIWASTGRNDFIFDIWLWHGHLYCVSPLQAYCTSTSCLPCDLEFFMFAIVKIFVTDISASTARNDFIFDMWLWHGDLYHISPFQFYCTSTSCLLCDLEFSYIKYKIISSSKSWDICYENFHYGKHEKF